MDGLGAPAILCGPHNYGRSGRPGIGAKSVISQALVQLACCTNTLSGPFRHDQMTGDI